MRLLDYASNVHSQNGEDGILAKILDMLPTKDQWAVEFGAWDGEYLSNTCNLLEHKGYGAVLIEANRAKHAELVRKFADNPRIIPIQAFVGFRTQDGLDHILSRTPIPKDFDLLSIDIDGNDYHVWRAVTQYTPKVVCVEYNPTVPNGIEFVQPADPRLSQGASLRSLVQLGKQKGYELVCVTLCNAIFVRESLFPLFAIADNSHDVLREDTRMLTYVFSGYDGTLFIRGNEYLGWHGNFKIEKRLRQFPKFFRALPDNFGTVQRLAYKFYWRAARLMGRG